MNKLKDIIKKSDRYSDFTLLEDPLKFSQLFKDKNFDLVQVHSTQIIEIDEYKDIVGFIGIFEWNNNILKSLDGDIYDESMLVIGYSTFTNETEGIKSGIDILV